MALLEPLLKLTPQRATILQIQQKQHFVIKTSLNKAHLTSQPGTTKFVWKYTPSNTENIGNYLLETQL